MPEHHYEVEVAMRNRWDDGAAARTLGAFVGAAEGFVDLVGLIEGGWDTPGLGAWDLRALVGHTSRSLITVTSYLDRPAPAEELVTAAHYVVASSAMVRADPDASLERGRQAGRDLGTDPAGVVSQLARAAFAKLAVADPEALIETIAGGMRVRTYLLTRVFELVVHSFDIADAIGVEAVVGDAPLAEAAAVAAQAAVALGHGPDLLRGLTGRGPWPAGFVVVS